MNIAQAPYDISEQNPFLRVELAKFHLLLSMASLLCAKHECDPSATAGTNELLRMQFVTHSVTIHGKGLSHIFYALQKGRLESVRNGSGGPEADGSKTNIISIIAEEPAT